jgi:hypothetical protein
MNRKTLFTGVLLLTCGCTGLENTDRGAATGGILGGILGLGVGAITHHPLAGAAIGAGAGALAGGAIGNAEDRAEAKAVAAARAAHPPLSLEDVARMAQQRVSDAVIINEIRTTNSFYSLNADHVIWLKQQGVSDYVIAEMQSRTPIYGPPGPRVVVVEPQPPVAVGVGFVGRWR